MIKQSFNSKVSQLSAPHNVMRISPTTEKNSVLLRRVPSPESTLSILRDDIVVRHLVGEYNSPDRYAFAEKIAEEIQGNYIFISSPFIICTSPLYVYLHYVITSIIVYLNYIFTRGGA